MKKAKTAVPQHKQKGILPDLDRWLKDFFIGKAPTPNVDYLHTGRITVGLKSVTTKNIESIIEDSINKGKHYKFGKTGHAPTRGDQEDYRIASYKTMYLLYESSSESNVELLEIYYATKYKRKTRCDNKDVNSLGKMKSLDGRYYLYLVI